MFRVSLANAFAKRTCKPLLEKHQATPVAGSLASANVSSRDVYSGMVAARNSDGDFVPCDGATMVPVGLFALDCNATINDLDGQPSDIAPFAVWQGGPDAYFQVDTLSSDANLGAFEDSGTFAVGTILYAATTGGNAVGQITDAANTDAMPIGRVVEVVSATRLIVQILLPGVAGIAADVTGFGDPT